METMKEETGVEAKVKALSQKVATGVKDDWTSTFH